MPKGVLLLIRSRSEAFRPGSRTCFGRNLLTGLRLLERLQGIIDTGDRACGPEGEAVRAVTLGSRARTRSTRPQLEFQVQMVHRLLGCGAVFTGIQ
jgi:hypothetical protein